MQRIVMKSKIHRATVTDADLNYQGSITIDRDLMDAADLVPYERVQVVNIDNGSRFETYVIEGDRGTGTVCVNGAAARLVHKGDKIIVISYAGLSEDELVSFEPRIVKVDADNHHVISLGQRAGGTEWAGEARST